jgi:myo-inositol catabolism protein IolS
MEKMVMGPSNEVVHPIGMGCWAFGGGEYWGEQSQYLVDNLVHRALDLGINFFDTAEMYNNGASEEALGTALKGRRNEAIICSKVSPSNAYPKVLREHFESSVKRLKTDYLDMYMLHWPINLLSIKHFTNETAVMSNPPSVFDAFQTLLDLKNEGKIREIGVSNFGVCQMSQVIDMGIKITANELPYNILSRAIEVEIIPFCIANNISVIGSMALQQGLLANIYDTAAVVPPAQAHSRHFCHERGGKFSRHGENGAEKEVFECIKELKTIADEIGIQMAQLSIAWVLSKPGLKCTLVGSRDMKELETNIKTVEVMLNGNIIERINNISEAVLLKLGNNPDYYESSDNSRIK